MTRRKVPPSESGTFTLSTTSAGVLRFSPERREAWIGDRYVTLNEQDCRLLRALIEERGLVVTRTALMLATWGAASRERIALLETAIWCQHELCFDRVPRMVQQPLVRR